MNFLVPLLNFCATVYTLSSPGLSPSQMQEINNKRSQCLKYIEVCLEEEKNTLPAFQKYDYNTRVLLCFNNKKP